LLKKPSENAHGRAQKAENGSGFDLSTEISQRCDKFYNHIVGDETWVLVVKVEIKEQSSSGSTHIHHTSRTHLNKRCLSARKLMATVFWDREGVLMVEFMRKGTTITSQVYCETQKHCLEPAVQKKRRGMLPSGVVFLHDNASPHTAACLRALLEHFNWELFDHTSYSPDLAPSEYHLFTYLKH
jgi:histone-lysine N-methyltransferase SETMAR